MNYGQVADLMRSSRTKHLRKTDEKARYLYLEMVDTLPFRVEVESLREMKLEKGAEDAVNDLVQYAKEHLEVDLSLELSGQIKC